MPTYSDFLLEGAQKLSRENPDPADPKRRLEFGFSVRASMWDPLFWEETGASFKGAKILRPVAGERPSRAVQAIFDEPWLWSFDCSQFCQVVSYYAQMKSLGPFTFDANVAARGGRLEIKPFRGAHFTMRKHYYRREDKNSWMEYQTFPGAPPVETRIKAWDLVRAAPVGSRVNFALKGGRGAWRYENVIKAKMSPLTFVGQGLTRRILKHDELVKALAKLTWSRMNPAQRMHFGVVAPPHHTMADATKLVWIKEVSIFQDLPFPYVAPVVSPGHNP